ncbi:MAG: hypothetical protein Q4G40_12420, partial [Brachybacterium sp.]|nr:hypothetical protein [Brachybacterium sp.]
DAAAGQATATIDDLEVFRLAEEDEELLVAVPAGIPHAAPRWVAGLPSGTGECTIDSSSIQCEGSAPIQARTGTVAAEDMSLSDAVDAGDGTNSAPTAAIHAPISGAAPSLRVGSSPTGDLPLSVDGSGKLNTAVGPLPGAQMEAGTPVWAVPLQVPIDIAGLSMPIGTREVWAVSDGSTLVITDAEEVTSSTELPAGTAELSRLGTEDEPRWIADASVLVVVSSDGMHALDAIDGSTAWQVDAPVDSWLADGSAVHLVSDGSIVTLDHATTSSVEQVDATGPPDGADPAAGPPVPMTTEELASATVEVPGVCAAFVMDEDYSSPDTANPDPREVTFHRGQAASSERPHATITVNDTQATMLDGIPVTVATMTCHGGGSYSYDVIAVYDPSGQYLGGLDMQNIDAPDRPQGTIHKTYLEDVTALGSTLRMTYPNIQVYGDDSCSACEPSARADTLYAWTGDSYSLVDARYTVPSGSVRLPDLEDVQRFVDLVAAGEDEQAEAMMTGQWPLGEFADNADLSDPMYMDVAPIERDWVFPADATVDRCELIGPVDSAGIASYQSYTMANGKRIWDPVFDYLDSRPGDSVCVITSESVPYLNPGEDSYEVYLVVAGNPNGDAAIRFWALGGVGD